MTDGPARAIFLSYASQDAQVAERLCQALRAASVEVWFDRSELRGGDAWDASIRKQIRACALFIPVISASTQARSEGYFRREWNLAVQRVQDMAEDQPFLLPVVVDDTPEGTARVPEVFRERHWIRLKEGEVPSEFPADVLRLLDAPPVAPRISPTNPVRAIAGRSKRRFTAGLATLIGVGAVGGWYAMRRSPGPDPSSGARASSADLKSIAILPFVDLSEARNMSHFADGMHDDLLTQLAMIGDLKVVSRTSVSDYRGTRKNVRVIGSELGVATLVEGSVRRAGDRVRVSAQLIDAQADKSLWANSYDRELKDIFAIQSELATEIARALKVSLTPRDQSQLERRPTRNLEAYELFLQHRQAWNRATLLGDNTADLPRRIDLLSRAVALDPDFALAWAILGAEEARVRFYYGEPASERLTKAHLFVERALRLAPDDLEVQLQLGYVHYYGDEDFPRAAQYVEGLLKRAPHHVEMLVQLALLRRREGRWADAVALLRKVISIDSRNGNATRTLSQILQNFRRYEESVELQRRIMELYPGNLDFVAQFHFANRLKSGSPEGYDAWRRTVTEAEAQKWDWVRFRDLFRAFEARDLEKALRISEIGPETRTFSRYGNGPLVRAITLHAMGRTAEARQIARARLPVTREALRRAPGDFRSMEEGIYLSALLGDRQGVLAELQRIKQLPRSRYDALFAQIVLMMEPAVLTLLGDRDAALKALARVAKELAGGYVLGGSEISRAAPEYATLWDMPEFLAIVRDPAHNAPLPIENRGIPRFSE